MTGGGVNMQHKQSNGGTPICGLSLQYRPKTLLTPIPTTSYRDEAVKAHHLRFEQTITNSFLLHRLFY